MIGSTPDWREELGGFLKPFLARLGHKARRRMCPLYVSGLIGPGDRKSIQPMAERFAFGDDDQLHHVIAAGAWDVAPLETELLVRADKLVGGRDAVLDGPPQRIRDKGQQHLPGHEVWLIGEHRASKEKKYYLANLPGKTDPRILAATIKARWICEQAHQRRRSRIAWELVDRYQAAPPTKQC